MKILRKPESKITDVNAKYTYEIAQKPDGVKIKINFHFNNAPISRDFFVSYKRYAGKVVELDVLETNNKFEIVPTEIFRLRKPALAPLDFRMARIAVNKEGTDSVIQLSKPCPPIGGIENVLKEDFETDVSQLVDQSPTAREVYKKFQEKQKMMSRIDVRDSISYLEAQIDILSRFIIEHYPNDNGELMKMMKEIDKLSVLNIKSNEKIMLEFENKKIVRDCQKSYYERMSNS